VIVFEDIRERHEIIASIKDMVGYCPIVDTTPITTEDLRKFRDVIGCVLHEKALPPIY